jgi:hypothetical protein
MIASGSIKPYWLCEHCFMPEEIDGQGYHRTSVKFEQSVSDAYPHLPQVPLYREDQRQQERTHKQGTSLKKAYGVIIIILLSSCLITGAGWLTTKRNIETLQTANTILNEQINSQNLQHSQALQEANYHIEVANQQVLSANQQALSANQQALSANQQALSANNRAELGNVTIGELKQELAGAEKWQDYWWQRAHPKEFESLDTLKAWLAQDDTDHAIYIFGSGCLTNYDCDDYAVALAYNALQDGYSVSTEIAGDHIMNSTIIGNEIYLIEPQTDEAWLWGKRD